MSRGATFATALLVSLLTSAGVSYTVVRHFAAAPAPPAPAGPIEVPSIVGLKADQARQILDLRGLLLMLSEEREDAKVEAGAICEQRPLPGSQAARGTAVQAVVSRGQAKRAQVPSVAGGTGEAAAAQLQAAGLPVGVITEQPSDTVAKGLVVSTTPPAGTEVAPGTSVSLLVSRGSEAVEVPNVVHKGISRAKKMLLDAGLTVGATRFDYDEDYGGNIVLRQQPAARTKVAKGTPVDLEVNESDD